MRKKKVLFVSMMMALMPLESFNLNVNAATVPLEIGYNDPTHGQGQPQRSPIPSVSIEDFTLTFTTPCYGWTLELLDEDGDLVYTTIITSATVNLPSTLSGEYQLCLIPNDGSSIYFYGYIVF